MTVGVALVAIGAAALVSFRPQTPTIALPVLSSPATTRGPEPPAPLRAPEPRDVPTGRLPDTISRVPTTDRVVFLTIDDGYVRDPAAVAQIRQAQVPVSLFLVATEARAGHSYFADLVAAGATVGNHTLGHPELSGMPLTTQVDEICGASTLTRQLYGVSPTLFRPPFGSFDATTRHAAARCGFSTMVLWEATVNDGVIRIKGGRERLLAGDIILLHFRPDLSENLAKVFAAVAAEGLRVGRLEDYVSG